MSQNDSSGPPMPQLSPATIFLVILLFVFTAIGFFGYPWVFVLAVLVAIILFLS